ncbi:MAG: hypothetical protein WAV41_05315 [Microgenomates group bacterium]
MTIDLPRHHPILDQDKHQNLKDHYHLVSTILSVSREQLPPDNVNWISFLEEFVLSRLAHAIDPHPTVQNKAVPRLPRKTITGRANRHKLNFLWNDFISVPVVDTEKCLSQIENLYIFWQEKSH